MSISVTSGASAIPSSGEMDSFSQGLKSQSTDSLIQQLGNSSTPAWEKDAISKELQNRAQSNSGTSGSSGTDGSDSSDDASELMKKLMNGSISNEELQKLAKMLGVDPSQLEALKGQGASDGTSGSGDITGG